MNTADLNSAGLDKARCNVDCRGSDSCLRLLSLLADYDAALSSSCDLVKSLPSIQFWPFSISQTSNIMTI